MIVVRKPALPSLSIKSFSQIRSVNTDEKHLPSVTSRFLSRKPPRENRPPMGKGPAMSSPHPHQGWALLHAVALLHLCPDGSGGALLTAPS